MQGQQAVQAAIAIHGPLLRRVKDEIAELNERLVHLSIQGELSPATRNSKLTANSIASEIQSTKFTLLFKIKERIKLEDILDLHRSVSTLLPFEIWAQIFSLCMPDTRYPRWNNQFTPVVLGRVCSRWRSMTRLMPELWSSISLDILPGIGNKQPRWMPLIHAFLNRSADHPLSIQIIWYQFKFEQGQRTYKAYLLDLITSSSTRWKDIDLTVPSETLHPFLDANLPILETFTIGSDSDPPLNLRAPRLCSVMFSGYYTRPLTWNVPWIQLTELGSKSLMGVNDVKRILNRCPHLQYFHLRISGNPPWSNSVAGDVQIPQIVTLRELKRFALAISHGENVLHILHQFNFPVLEEIRFSGAQGRALSYSTVLWPKPFILALISRSGCSVQKLVFENFPKVNDLEVRDLLNRIPSLKELEFTCNGNDALNDTFKGILADRRKKALSLD
ncbi:hypothetical protein L218DRAFT_954041 [Marasmius fiardii PR-910]|nr:hypothetical protein L218DRAFT_954041 [Marasmius fiardii PR-910]